MTDTLHDIIAEFHKDLKEACDKHPNLHHNATKLIHIFNLTIFDSVSFKYRNIVKRNAYDKMKAFIKHRIKFFNILIIVGFVLMILFAALTLVLAFDFYRHDEYYNNVFSNNHLTALLQSQGFITFKICVGGFVFVLPLFYSFMYIIIVHGQYNGMNKLMNEIMSKEKIE